MEQAAGRPGAALCQSQMVHPVPPGAAVAPPQDAAEPIGQAGGTSVKTYSRKGKSTTQAEKMEDKK